MSAPRALLFTTQRWPAAAMMARSLRDGGFIVGALCPAGHPLRMTVSARVVGRYRHLTVRLDLDRAIDRWRPDILLACDDLAVDVLHAAHRRYVAGGVATSCAKARLVEASFGASASFATTRSKSRVVQAAAALGIAVPRSLVVEDVGRLADRLRTVGFPAVLKADALWGGLGVKIVGSAAEAEAAYAELTRPPGWPEVARQVARGGGLAPALDRLRFRAPVVSAQQFVAGRPANAAAVCWQGEMLACTTVEVLRGQRNNGPGSVVRVIEHAAIERAVRRLTEALGLSGFCGFDFMLDHDSGEALLLEINPRATSSSFLPTAAGGSLARHLHARLTGSSLVGQQASVTPRTVVLFPQELERDPTSDFLDCPGHLVPWDEPALVAACLSVAFGQTLPDRAVARLRSLLRRQGAGGQRMLPQEAPHRP